ncbi:MAG: Zn-binding domain-containing protein, partial [Halanaerobiales bacterium]
THENVGCGDIHLPEVEMHTSSYWFCFPDGVEERFGKERLEQGLTGMSGLLANIAPLNLMCSPNDINSAVQVRSPYTGLPTVFIYESYPGGLGMSEKLFRDHDELLPRALEHLRECNCDAGCPGCVGPADEVGQEAKAAAQLLLKEAIDGEYPG